MKIVIFYKLYYNFVNFYKPISLPRPPRLLPSLFWRFRALTKVTTMSKTNEGSPLYAQA